jgi:hypothetical protein
VFKDAEILANENTLRLPKNSRLPLKERELKGIIELKSLLFPFKKGRN